MPGEAYEPRLPVGMDLLKLMERIKEDLHYGRPASGKANVDMALEFLDRLLDEARAEERASISFQLGLVAGEGYKLFNSTLDALEHLMNEVFAPNPGVPKTHLRRLVRDARAFTFSGRPAGASGA